MQHITGASMPRSGHHLLHRLLSDYFAEAFGYCSFYFPWEFDSFPECCGQIPCRKALAADFQVFLQKSHDFDLTDPIDDSSFRVVQVREPVSRLFSNFRLHVRNNPKRNTRSNFMNFATREYYYYVAFWMKWVRADNYVLTYEHLTLNPVGELEKLVSAIGLDPNRSRIQDVADAQLRMSADNRAAFKPSQFRSHEFFDEKWAAEYAANIARACTGYESVFADS